MSFFAYASERLTFFLVILGLVGSSWLSGGAFSSKEKPLRAKTTPVVVHRSLVSQFKRAEKCLERELLEAKIDFLLNQMLAVSQSMDATIADSNKFAHSGAILGRYYDCMSAHQKNKFMQAITI